jgi:hypothetical protein
MVFRGERGRSRAPKRERVVGTGGGRKVKKKRKETDPWVPQAGKRITYRV